MDKLRDLIEITIRKRRSAVISKNIKCDYNEFPIQECIDFIISRNNDFDLGDLVEYFENFELKQFRFYPGGYKFFTPETIVYGE